MKVKGEPVLYDLYEGKPCYHVEFFEDELCLLDQVLQVFCHTKLYGALCDEWSELEQTKFEEAMFQITFALCRINDGNVTPSGLVVNDDETP